MTVEPALIKSLACPKCKDPLIFSERLSCTACSKDFPIRQGIPVFIPENPTDQDGMDPIAREEAGQNKRRNKDEEMLHIFRDIFGHPFDYDQYCQRVEGVRRALISWPDVRRLVLIGGSTGNEAAMLKKSVPAIREVIIVDLGFQKLRLATKAFRHLGVDFNQTYRLQADFNSLPFSPFGYDTVGLAFRCLHHSEDINRPLAEMFRVFSRVIIVEPVWSLPIRFLARLRFANRPEHVDDHSPQRLDPAALKRPDWSSEVRHIIEFPRDRLPGLQKRQGRFKPGDISPFESGLSKVYSTSIHAMNYVSGFLHIGNYMQATMIRRTAHLPNRVHEHS